MPRTIRLTAALCATLALVACAPPKPPEEERRPAPQSQPDAGSASPSAIVEHANAYKDRAREAVQQAGEAADRERAAADAAAR